MVTEETTNNSEGFKKSNYSLPEKLLSRINDSLSDKEAFIAYYGDLFELNRDGYHISKKYYSKTILNEWKQELLSKMMTEVAAENLSAIKYLGIYKVKESFDTIQQVFYSSQSIEAIAECAETLWMLNKFHDEKYLIELYFEKANHLEKRQIINGLSTIITSDSNDFIVQQCLEKDNLIRLVALRALRRQIIDSKKRYKYLFIYYDKLWNRYFDKLEEDNYYKNSYDDYFRKLIEVNRYFKADKV